jgi:hypothetical protein
MLRHFTTSSTYLQSADHAEAGDQHRPPNLIDRLSAKCGKRREIIKQINDLLN